MNVPRLSQKEAEILRLLVVGGEMYGLEMVHSSKKLARGTVYVTLQRMGEKGYVESRQSNDPRTPGLPRRLYTPTGLGARALRAHQAASLAAEQAFAW